MNDPYVGITYPSFLLRFSRLWKRFMCPRNMHLWDECYSPCSKQSPHTLHCDCCGLVIVIKEIMSEEESVRRVHSGEDKDPLEPPNGTLRRL